MKWKIILFYLVFIAGMVILFNSVDYGLTAVNRLVSEQNGMNTETYHVLVKESIGVFKWIGALLSIAGSMGIIIKMTRE